MASFKPTQEQQKIIDTPDSAIVIAGPGTGKTHTAVEKAKNQISDLQNMNNRDVLFLSFSNAAIYSLLKEVNLKFSVDERKKVNFRTYHSFAAEILRHYGRFTSLPPSIKIMDTLEETLIGLEKGWDTTNANYSQHLFDIAKSEGLLAFETLLPLTLGLLISSERLRTIISRQYPLIIVDEFQDTNEDQWKLLKLIGQENQVIVFGDPNQIIYSSFHAATEKRLDEFLEWKGIDLFPFSDENFRCKRPEILRFANSLLKGSAYDDEDDNSLNIFKLKYRSELRSQLALIWKEIRKQVGVEQTIAFVAPSNLIAEDIATALRNPPSGSKISFPVYAGIIQNEAANDAILLALAAMSDFASSPNNISCRKASISLLAMDMAWNSRKKMSLKKIDKISKLLNRALDKNDTNLSKLLINLKTRIGINTKTQELIDALVEESEFSTTCKKIASYGRLKLNRVTSENSQLNLFEELREHRHPKGLEGYDSGTGKTSILTYHKAKGREFDFVVMIVDPRGESNKVNLEEMRRLYYVCATRAKQWLGVIYYRNELGRVLGPVLQPV